MVSGLIRMERRFRLDDPAHDLPEGRLMKINLNGLALIALTIAAAPGFAAEPDTHAGHHPASPAATPIVRRRQRRRRANRGP